MHITNDSNINIRSVGQSSDNPNGALQCITDKIRCCMSQNPRPGEWYLPTGALVHGGTSTTEIYRSRGDNGEVSLNRPSNVESPTGLFCCEVPDATGTNQTLCVNIGKLFIKFISVLKQIKVARSTCMIIKLIERAYDIAMQWQYRKLKK